MEEIKSRNAMKMRRQFAQKYPADLNTLIARREVEMVSTDTKRYLTYKYEKPYKCDRIKRIFGKILRWLAWNVFAVKIIINARDHSSTHAICSEPAFFHPSQIAQSSTAGPDEMKSNDKDDKSEFHEAESSEDTSGFFESSSTLNNEKLYMASTPDQAKAFANSRLRSAKLKMQQVCETVI